MRWATRVMTSALVTVYLAFVQLSNVFAFVHLVLLVKSKACTSLSGREDLSWHEVRKRAGRLAQPKLSRKKRRLGKLSRKSGHRKQKW